MHFWNQFLLKLTNQKIFDSILQTILKRFTKSFFSFIHALPFKRNVHWTHSDGWGIMNLCIDISFMCLPAL